MSSSSPPPAGETDLRKLLATMVPALDAETFVFAVTKDKSIVAALLAADQLQGFFKEEEGKLTVITSKSAAEAHALEYNYVCKKITLTVHSALEAVGLTAAFARELAAHGLSANVVAGYLHDHIFVGEKDGEAALKVLEDFSAKARAALSDDGDS